MTQRRYAIVKAQADRLTTLQRYMPSNYNVAAIGADVLVSGEDVAGWTLDGYVLPRLASGLYFGTEVSEDDALVASIAAHPIMVRVVDEARCPAWIWDCHNDPYNHPGYDRPDCTCGAHS